MTENGIKTIGVLTSGGDAPGMNAVVRAVVRTAIGKGMKVYGIRRGYTGLMAGDVFEMNLRSVSNIMNLGGTVLYTSRAPEFVTPEGQQRAVDVCKYYGIEGIVTIGGDGTFRGAGDLSKKGIPCVGVPGTIDNDIASTDYSIGFDTAVNTAIEMIDRLRDTSQSHDRCSVVQVMGRQAGFIALHAGIATGAIAVLVPEVPIDLEEKIIPKMLSSLKRGKQHFLIVVAEGVGNVEEIAETISEKVGIVTRITVLGHVQRGGMPTARDRIVASQMGHRAVELLAQGKESRVVGYRCDEIVDYDIAQALAMKKTLDMELYNVADEISI